MTKIYLIILSLAITPLWLCPKVEAQTQESLPKVLIIGDSISIGYTPHVARILKGKAIIHHHRGNAQHTGTGLKKISQWIGDTKWDIIHFNWGLWDLCYRHPDSKIQGKRDKLRGTVTTPIDQYKNNLEELIHPLKITEAKLIFANTTMIPEGEAGRKVGDDERYNDAAEKVMQKHAIPINDLHSLTKKFPSQLFIQPGDVHYTPKGYQQIAQQVSQEILTAIKSQ